MNVRIAVLSAYDRPLAFLDNDVPAAMHYWNELLHVYISGSAYTFEFSASARHADSEFLVEGNKISFQYKDKDYYCNIVKIDRDEDTVDVSCYGLTFELLNEETNAYKAASAMSFTQYLTAFNFEQQAFRIGMNQVAGRNIKHEWTGVDTVLSRLYSLANVFSAEIEFITVLNPDYSLKEIILNIYNEHTDSNQATGTDRRSTILRYPDPIASIRKKADITGLFTAIRPFGRDGLTITGYDQTVKDSNGNVLYRTSGRNILAPQARDRFPSTLEVGPAGRYICKIWNYDTESKATLYGQALAELKKISVPDISYEIDGYIDADIGDTYTIEDSGYKPTLYIEARVTEQEISFTDKKKCKTTFDNFRTVRSKIDPALIKAMNELISENAIYSASVMTSNGTVFKEPEEQTVLTAVLKDGINNVASKYNITWYRNNEDEPVFIGSALLVMADSFENTVTYRFEALDDEGKTHGSAQVTLARYRDGSDGLNAFLHIAYANSEDGAEDFSITDAADKKYIGAYSDHNQYGSGDPGRYSWTKIQGPKGETGVGIDSAVHEYYLSTSKQEQIGGSWSQEYPQWMPDTYLWIRNQIVYTNGVIEYSSAWCDSAWEVVNAVDEKIDTVAERLTVDITDLSEDTQTNLSEMENSIISSVESKYYSKDDTDTMLADITSIVTQNSDNIEMRFESSKAYADSLKEDSDNSFRTIQEYIRFSGANIYLGKAESPMTLHISNDKVSFLQSGTEVAYLSNNKLYVRDAEILGNLQLGKFAYVIRPNGSLDFKKVGD